MKTVINIKTDKNVKLQAQKIAKEIGLPLSTLVSAYLKQFIRTQEVYLSTAPRMTKNLEKVVAQAHSDLKAKKNISPAFSSIKAMDDYLDGL